jgi:hypothetical protein
MYNHSENEILICDPKNYKNSINEVINIEDMLTEINGLHNKIFNVPQIDI